MSAVVVPHPASPHHGQGSLHGLGLVDLPAPPGVPSVDPQHIPYLVKALSAEAAVLLVALAHQARYDRTLGWVVDGGTATISSWFDWGRERASTALRRLHSAGLIERGQRDRLTPSGRTVRAEAYIALRPTGLGTDRHRVLPAPERVPADAATVEQLPADSQPRTGDRQEEHPSPTAAHGHVEGRLPDAGDPPATAPRTSAEDRDSVDEPSSSEEEEDKTWGEPLPRSMLLRVLAAWGFDGAEAAIRDHGQQLVSDAVKAVAWKKLRSPKTVGTEGGYVRTVINRRSVPTPPAGLPDAWRKADLDLTAVMVPSNQKDVLAEAQKRWEQRRRYVDAIFSSLTAADQERLATSFEHLAEVFAAEDPSIREFKETLLWEDLLANEGLLAPPDALPALG